jgi:HEPN domain-containing protein
MEWPRKNEVLFKIDKDWQYNACLSPYDSCMSRYGEKYKTAADTLIDSSIYGDAYVDSIVYPAVFLYRQYLELTLKDIISTARQLENEGSGYPRTHKLRDLWIEAKRLISKHYEGDTPKELAYLASCIEEFHKHDPDSFAFRYPTDKRGKLNLLELKHINLRNLKETMERISNFLGCLASDLGAHLDACIESMR